MRATTALTLRTLNGTVSVAAVAGYSHSAEAADHVVARHLSRFHPELNPQLPTSVPL